MQNRTDIKTEISQATFTITKTKNIVRQTTEIFHQKALNNVSKNRRVKRVIE